MKAKHIIYITCFVFVGVVGLFIALCTIIRYPESKFLIDKKIRDYLSFYKPNDTLLFQDSKSKIDTFLITYIDSVTYNPTLITFWPPTEPFKWIQVHYRQIPKDTWHSTSLSDSGEKFEDASLIWVYQYPESGKTTYEITFNFKKLYTWYEDPIIVGVLRTDTIVINHRLFTNYSDIPINEDQKWQNDSNYVTDIYWINKYGIIAYKYKNGDIWKRINLK